MERAIQGQAIFFEKEQSLLERVPLAIKWSDLNKSAMYVKDHVIVLGLSAARLRELKSYHSDIERHIRELKAFKAGLNKLLAANRIVPSLDEVSFIDKMRSLTSFLEGSKNPSYLADFRDSFLDSDTSSADAEMKLLKEDVDLYFNENPICHYSLLQLESVCKQLLELINLQNEVIHYDACFFIGFSDIDKVGVYDRNGLFLELIPFPYGETAHVFCHCGNNFLLD